MKKSAKPFMDIQIDSVPTAQITHLSFTQEAYFDKPGIHFVIALKNISNTQKTFNVTAVFDDSAALGGPVPRSKGMKPGEVKKEKFGATHGEQAQKVTITIEEVK